MKTIEIKTKQQIYEVLDSFNEEFRKQGNNNEVLILGDNNAIMKYNLILNEETPTEYGFDPNIK